VTAGTWHGATPLAPIVDEQRIGSAGGQVAVGIAGIVLAVILVMGQLSLAMTKGIATHMSASVAHIAKGNEVMESVIERSAPSVTLEKVLKGQAATLANTHDTMVMTNEQMRSIGGTTTKLDGIVASMEKTSDGLASYVSGMQKSSKDMADTLGGLPAATKKTHVQLGTINGDTNAINAELAAISKKMAGYGLPKAEGAPKG